MKKISTYHDIQLRITQKAHYGILISIVVRILVVLRSDMSIIMYIVFIINYVFA